MKHSDASERIEDTPASAEGNDVAAAGGRGIDAGRTDSESGVDLVSGAESVGNRSVGNESVDDSDASADLDETSDEALMDRYCAGDTAAFAQLFSRFNGRLVRFLTQMVGPTTAVDIAQITFMKVHENRHRYKSGHNLAAWMFTIARNSALDFLRSAPRRREVTGIDIDPGQEGVRRDLFRDDQVRLAVHNLPDDQKQVILLHWFGDLTFEEVANIVGASAAAVRVRAHRGYQKLRVSLDALKKEGASG